MKDVFSTYAEKMVEAVNAVRKNQARKKLNLRWKEK
jgi:hypothetical protein